MAASSEFCSRMAVLIDCRLPLHEALSVTAATLRDPYLAEMTQRLARRAENGESVDSLAQSSPALHHQLANSFRWAKSSEAYADVLRSLAIIFGAQSRSVTSMIAMLMEPFAIAGIGVAVGLIVGALFAPMIQLLNELS